MCAIESSRDMVMTSLHTPEFDRPEWRVMTEKRRDSGIFAMLTLRSLALLALGTAATSLRALPALGRARTVTSRAACVVAAAGTAGAAAPVPMDLVGDGGVIKTVMRGGAGEAPTKGAIVEVHYDGKLLPSGDRFDSSRERGKTFKFTLGEGKVIGGWEVGVASMRVGELSVLQCAPQYAYGEKGIPPTIPPAATLQFEVELLSLQQPKQEARTFADDNPEPPRTPAEIEQAYARRMATKEVPKSGLDGALDWIKNIYIIGLFRGEKGVRARTQRALRGEGRSVSLMRGPLDRRRAAAVVPQPADHIPFDLRRRRRRFLSRDLARRGASRRGCARWRRSERHPRRRDPMIRR